MTLVVTVPLWFVILAAVAIGLHIVCQFAELVKKYHELKLNKAREKDYPYSIMNANGEIGR
jgi:hypothetical protein